MSRYGWQGCGTVVTGSRITVENGTPRIAYQSRNLAR